MKLQESKFLLSIFFTAIFTILPSMVLALNFPDVATEGRSHEAIDYMFKKGWIGYPDGTFRPQDKINRAEFIKMVVEVVSSKDGEDTCREQQLTKNLFNDVKATDWYAPYVCKGKLMGWIKGYEDGSFKPEQNINFAEAAKIIVSAGLLTLKEGEPDIFVFGMMPDDLPWYIIPVESLSRARAIPKSVLSLDQRVTREEVAEILYRLDAVIRDKESWGADDLEDLSVISNYYGNFGVDLAAAYELKSPVNRPSLDSFKKMYKNVAAAKVSDVLKFDEHRFAFVVTLDELNSSSKYVVRMAVDNGKLLTISSDLIDFKNLLAEIMFDDSMYVRVVEKDNWQEVWLYKNGVKSLVYKGKSWDKDGLYGDMIQNIKFSEDGRYLSIEISNWEQDWIRIYDSVTEKLSEVIMPNELYGFSEDLNFFWACEPNGMSGGGIALVRLWTLDQPNIQDASVENLELNISQCVKFYPIYEKANHKNQGGIEFKIEGSDELSNAWLNDNEKLLYSNTLLPKKK